MLIQCKIGLDVLLAVVVHFLRPNVPRPVEVDLVLIETVAPRLERMAPVKFAGEHTSPHQVPIRIHQVRMDQTAHDEGVTLLLGGDFEALDLLKRREVVADAVVCENDVSFGEEFETFAQFPRLEVECLSGVYVHCCETMDLSDGVEKTIGLDVRD